MQANKDLLEYSSAEATSDRKCLETSESVGWSHLDKRAKMSTMTSSGSEGRVRDDGGSEDFSSSSFVLETIDNQPNHTENTN